MIRKPATAVEIRTELRRRIDACDDLEGNCRSCGVPEPRSMGSKEVGGPNWGVDALPELAHGCFAAILKIVDQARLEFELVASPPR